jgi:HSP20 family protein
MTNLTRYTPKTHMGLFDDIFPNWMNADRFDNFFTQDPFSSGLEHRQNCKYRFEEDDDNYRMDVVMPGLTKKDIDMQFRDGVLTIKCKKEISDGDRQFYGVKSAQSFSNFPAGVNSEKIKAEMVDGVLNITLPKKEPNKTKSIDIA